MKRHFGCALALGVLELVICTSTSRAESLDSKPLGLAIANVDYDHLVAGHKQTMVITEPYTRWLVIVRNFGESTVQNVSISMTGNTNPAFYVEPFTCIGVTLQQHEECYFIVQWIIPDTNKRIFNDVLVVSGETDTEQVSVALHLKGVQE